MRVSRFFVLALLLLVGNPAAAFADEGKVMLVSKAPFLKVAAALELAIADQQMGLVCHACDPVPGGSKPLRSVGRRRKRLSVDGVRPGRRAPGVEGVRQGR